MATDEYRRLRVLDTIVEVYGQREQYIARILAAVEHLGRLPAPHALNGCAPREICLVSTA